MQHPFSLIAVFHDDHLNFTGNTSSVVLLSEPWAPDKMQAIASDFNQPATTFLWKENSEYRVRWFAPDAEIGLCGHGTLAAFAYLDTNERTVLSYNGGKMIGQKKADGSYSMELSPIISQDAGSPDKYVTDGLDKKVIGYFKNDNKYIVLLENEDAVKTLKPDFGTLSQMEPFGIIVTAAGENSDFVSRTLVPKVQQLEDHATGSSHAALTPFWSKRLNKSEMTGLQLSPRGGKFNCLFENDKVILSGGAKLIASGMVHD